MPVVALTTGSCAGLDRVSYITFLGVFDHLQDISKDKKNSQYREYLFTLLEYLHSYVERVKPLLDMGEELDSVNKEFAEQWDNGKSVLAIILQIFIVVHICREVNVRVLSKWL